MSATMVAELLRKAAASEELPAAPESLVVPKMSSAHAGEPPAPAALWMADDDGAFEPTLLQKGTTRPPPLPVERFLMISHPSVPTPLTPPLHPVARPALVPAPAASPIGTRRLVIAAVVTAVFAVGTLSTAAVLLLT